MPEVVSGVADADGLAAEYVLGTLDAEERAQARSLVAAEEAFAGKVKVWERRLGELHLMVEPVEPDAGIWERIRTRLPESRPAAAPEGAIPPVQAEQPPAPELPELPEEAASPLLPQPPAADEPDATAPAGDDTAAAPLPDALARRISEEPARSPAVVPPLPTLSTAEATLGRARTPAVAAQPAAVAASRELVRWRALAALLLLIVLGAAGLLGAWRFAPDRVPAALQPVKLMQLMGVDVAPPSAPQRRPAPPESRFDE
jgi:hypothetical protein